MFVVVVVYLVDKVQATSLETYEQNIRTRLGRLDSMLVLSTLHDREYHVSVF